MQEFGIYFKLGIEHILDLAGYDHMLFIIVLAAAYSWSERRPLLVLITAFTVGHSLSLGLAAYQLVKMDMRWVEFTIPLTILCAAAFNLTDGSNRATRPQILAKYGMALFFGMIHGLGFGAYLRAILIDQAKLPANLLAFNLGIEVAQIVVVAAVMLAFATLVRYAKVPRKGLLRAVSAAVAIISLILCFQNLP